MQHVDTKTPSSGLEWIDTPITGNTLLADMRARITSVSVNASAIFPGVSHAMQRVCEAIEFAAPATAPILLIGEAGTGKDTFARVIHQKSAHADGPFIKFDCSTGRSELSVARELFGWTDPRAIAPPLAGKLVQATGGTLYLDNVTHLPPRVQARLVRALEEKVFEGEGGLISHPFDTRIICSSRQPLEQNIVAGMFRSDLYYHLQTIRIDLPVLTDRKEDVPGLVSHFMQRFNATNGLKAEVSAEALHMLQRCRWPGNVRELEKCVEHLAITTANKQETLPRCAFQRCLASVLDRGPTPLTTEQMPSTAPEVDAAPLPAAPPLPTPAADAGLQRIRVQRHELLWALEQCGWVQAKAARLLRITPRQIGYAIEKYAIELKRF